MNVFDLVTELRLMFEMNAKNDISNVYNIFKHFFIFEILLQIYSGKNCKLSDQAYLLFKGAKNVKGK